EARGASSLARGIRRRHRVGRDETKRPAAEDVGRVPSEEPPGIRGENADGGGFAANFELLLDARPDPPRATSPPSCRIAGSRRSRPPERAAIALAQASTRIAGVDRRSVTLQAPTALFRRGS